MRGKPETERLNSGLPTLPANLCPLSGSGEFARFADNLGEPVGEAVEASAGWAMWQHAAEHLEHMLSCQHGINYSLLAYLEQQSAPPVDLVDSATVLNEAAAFYRSLWPNQSQACAAAQKVG